MIESNPGKRSRWVARVAMLAALAMPVSAMAQEGPPAGPQAGGMPDVNTVLKDLTPIRGLFTLYRSNPQDPTKDHTQLLAVIPKSLLNQDLLLATSISRGAYMGYQWNDYLVRWEQVGRRLVLRTPDVRYVETPGQPVTDAIRATYTPSFLTALPIITMTPAGDPVVDLAPFLISRSIELPVPPGTEPRRDLSSYTKVKAFPENVLIDVDIAYATRTGPGTSVGVSYAFRKLPDLKSYQPRLADERLGYFNTVRQDWNTKYTERENIVRYINRWSIRKKDPSLELSPPDKPIVFIIEKTVPLQWRRYVKEGIEEWNKAFEKIGIVGAIVVQQQTEDNEFADIDPEDARYNFIRWIVTGRPFAMGPSRADPRTGQILDADIIFDDSMLRYQVNDFDVFGPKGAAAQGGPELLHFIADNPEFVPHGQNAAEYKEAAEQFDGLVQKSVDGAPEPINLRHRLSGCNYAVGLRHQLAISSVAMMATATGKKIPERLIGTAIKETMAHEVGHTLGLRHNFKASAWLSLEEIRQRRDTSDEPISSSVMDYNALLFFPGDDVEKVRNFANPAIGPYDYWVIEYGYRTPSREDGTEAAMLAKIASRSPEKALAYLTDEDVVGTTSVDPDANRWDMAADPLEWAKIRIALADSLLKDIKTWAVRADGPNHELRGYFSTVMFEKVRNLQYVSRTVGGQYHNRNRPGDPEARPALQIVEAARQREAMKLIGETILSDSFFNFEPALLNELVATRWSDFAGRAPSRVDFPVHQTILNMQNLTLTNLVSPAVLQRIYDAEMKSTAEDKYTAAEHLSLLRTTIFGDLKAPQQQVSDAKPFISSIRRNLQMQYLSYMLAAAESQPGALMSADLQSMVRFSMRDLGTQIEALLKAGKLDLASRAHLTEAKNRIDRVLNVPAQLVPGTAGATITIGAEPAN